MRIFVCYYKCYGKLKLINILLILRNMNRYYKNTIVLFCISFLCSCASITTGSNQSVSVSTEPESGANCELRNNKGVWYVSST